MPPGRPNLCATLHERHALCVALLGEWVRWSVLVPIVLQTDPTLLPSMDDLLGKHVDLRKVRKIGEGERTAAGRVWACWSQRGACIAPQRQLYAKMNAPLISAASQAQA